MINFARINSTEKRQQNASSSGNSGASEYELQSEMLVLPVNSTTITTRDAKTAVIATNDHIKIVDVAK